MKAPLLTLFAALLALPLLAETVAPDGNSHFREWKDTSGRTVEATFRGVENGQVFLQTRNGYVHRIPLDRLSPEDQKLAQTLKPEGLGIPKDPNVAQAAAVIDKGVLMGLTGVGQKPNALASDEQFIRRVYLDLAGRIPTKAETVAFLNDTSSSKRANVIDTLINDDGFSSRMYNYFSDMLRIADDAQKSKFFTYQEWLKKQLADNRPWNAIVKDLMVADGKLLENGATGYLLRDRGMRLDNLSLTLSTFLGANVSCAQCHDHPFADWTQKQFYEMAAFFGASETYNRKDGGNYGLRTLRETLTPRDFGIARRLMYANQLNITDGKENDLKLPEDYKYKDAKPGDEVEPKLVKWTANDHRLRCYQDAEAAVKKADDDSQLREIFANWMTSADNPRFAMTIANRMWKLMFGIGIKEPVTDLDDPHACSNPLLLQHLANEMVRLKFDLRAFVRLICNTQTYQREAVTRELALGEHYYFPGPILRRMTAEQAWDSCVTLAIGDKVDGFKVKRAETYANVMNITSEVTPELIQEKITAIKSSMRDPAMGLGNGAAKGKGAKKKKKRVEPEAAEMSADEDGEFTRPEMMQGLALARASELRQPERDGHFLRMFGQSDRQIADSNSEEGSVPQVLMLMNGEAQEVLSDPRSLVLSTAMGATTPEEKVDSLYLSFFSRHPTAEESQEATRSLNAGLSSADLCWVLFNSREFVFVQ